MIYADEVAARKHNKRATAEAKPIQSNIKHATKPTRHVRPEILEFEKVEQTEQILRTLPNADDHRQGL